MLGDGDTDGADGDSLGLAEVGGGVRDGPTRPGDALRDAVARTAVRRGVRLTVGAAVRTGRGDHSRAVTDSGAAARLGAAPRTPLPAGADAGAGCAAGVPRTQPAANAKGNPRTRTPKKIDLGESRTD
ncbi:hypothetical protein KRM28CT15_65280 [Krasilnikovia sp. M28-CT-15]